MNVLRIEDCSISYGTQALAVERVSMEAKQGEIVSIVDRKSTRLNTTNKFPTRNAESA